MHRRCRVLVAVTLFLCAPTFLAAPAFAHDDDPVTTTTTSSTTSTTLRPTTSTTAAPTTTTEAPRHRDRDREARATTTTTTPPPPTTTASSVAPTAAGPAPAPVSATRRRAVTTTSAPGLDVGAAQADSLSVLPGEPTATSSIPAAEGEETTDLRPAEATRITYGDDGVDDLFGLSGLNLAGAIAGIAIAIAIAWVLLQIDRRRFGR
jgi:hypothetical protein